MGEPSIGSVSGSFWSWKRLETGFAGGYPARRRMGTLGISVAGLAGDAHPAPIPNCFNPETSVASNGRGTPAHRLRVTQTNVGSSGAEGIKIWLIRFAS
jgi:hypothetical protein